MINRILQLQKKIDPGQAWFVTNQSHIEYLTGFVSLLPTEREAFLWLTASSATLIHAVFSPAPEHEEIQYLLGSSTTQLRSHLQHLLKTEPIETVWIDGSTLWYEEFAVLSHLVHEHVIKLEVGPSHERSGSGSGSSEPSFLPTSELGLNQNPALIQNYGAGNEAILSARAIKDAQEITAIREASQIVARVLAEIRPQLKVGMTETYVTQLLETELRKAGSIQPAFPTIVSFGSHTALPHHQPTDFPLEENMPVLIDCGATVNRYKSDTTRSWWFGPDPDPEYQTIEQVVGEAYLAGEQTVRELFEVEVVTRAPSEADSQTTPDSRESTNEQALTTEPLAANKLDQVVRSVIQKAGYGPHFIHTTGHGVGLDIHEQPSIGLSTRTPLRAGMVITIEPGIYLENRFGIRFENTLVLSEKIS